MERKQKILGIGHCCQDTICTVEAYPPEDGSTHILSMDDSQGGGAVATALAAAAKLGASCAMIGFVGDDPTGSRILEGLGSFGVDVSGVRRIPGGRSSSSIVMVNPATGSRTKFPYRDALPPLPFNREQRERIAGASILHLDGTRYENALRAAEIAREAGTLVSLDGCSRQTDNAKNLRLAEMADILITNAVYPFAVSGKADRDEALAFLAGLGKKKAVVMTGGKEGCWAFLEGRAVHFPAFPVQAVDTTGAGDVFHGAFLVRWLETEDPVSAIRFASAAAALKCLWPGGRAGIPSREAADRAAESFSASSPVSDPVSPGVSLSPEPGDPGIF